MDEIFLMPETDKCLDYMHYEQYGFENKQFSLEHPMVCKMPCRDHDLSVIDEIPYLDDVTQPTFACVTHQSPECEEMLTVYTICASDDLITVKEVDEPIDDGLKMEENTCQPECSTHSDSDRSMHNALSTYMRNVPPDISVDIESSESKAEIQSVIQRTGSFELLSNSSETIRSGSTLTGYEFDTVKNLNLDSCSTSKLSLSLKSDGFDDFTLTPDEPRIMKNCDVEDFTLTPDASYSEPPFGTSSTDDVNNALDLFDIRSGRGMHGDNSDETSTLSNEVLMIVDKFLANERLLQQNLNIIPVKLKSMASPQISPIDSDASSMNLLIEKQKGTIFNLQSSSSKSTLDDVMDLEKINFDEEFSVSISSTSKNIDHKINPLETESDQIEHELTERQADTITNQLKEIQSNENDKSIIGSTLIDLPNDKTSKDHIPPPAPIMPSSRLSMQNLQPFFFSDDIAPKSDSKCDANKSDAYKEIVDTADTADTADTESNNDCCKMSSSTNDSSFLQKKILSKLKKNKSQSLGNLNKKTRCFPL